MGKRLFQLTEIDQVNPQACLLVDSEEYGESKKIKLENINLLNFNTEGFYTKEQLDKNIETIKEQLDKAKEQIDKNLEAIQKELDQNPVVMTPEGGIVFGDYETNQAGKGSVVCGSENSIIGEGGFGAGTENTISEQASGSAVFGVKNTIVNGSGHVVYGESNYIENIIKDADGRLRTFGSHCVSGRNNIINGGGFGVVLGESNTHKSGWGNILAGQNNKIDYTDFKNNDYNIVSGQGNHLVQGVSNIISGVNNKVTCQESIISGRGHILEKGGNLAIFGTGHYLSNSRIWSNLLVTGRYANVNSSEQLFIIGNGTSNSNRNNVFEIKSSVSSSGSNIKMILGGETLTPANIKDLKKIGDKADITYVDDKLAKIDAKLSTVYKYKGTVEEMEGLETIQNPEIGDVYNVIWDGYNNGNNYAWTGEKWDNLGATINLSGYATKEYVDDKVSSVDQTYSPTSENAQSGKAVAEALQTDIKYIEAGDLPERLELETNKIYTFDIYSNIAFALPEVDSAKFNSIELQVRIAGYENLSIDLGTTKYFGDIPELGDGFYSIYYEYIGGNWCVGALPVIEEQ